MDARTHRSLAGLLAGSETARARLAQAPSAVRSDITDAARDAFSFGLSGSFWILVVLVAVGAVLTWRFVQDPEEAEAVTDVEAQHRMHHRRFHL